MCINVSLYIKKRQNGKKTTKIDLFFCMFSINIKIKHLIK